MQFRWKRFIILLLAMVILLAVGAAVWDTSLKARKCQPPYHVIFQHSCRRTDDT